MHTHNPSYTIIFDLIDVLFTFNPAHIGTAQQFTPIKEGIEIVRQCHAQVDTSGRKRHKLYILSNAGIEWYQNLITHYPELFSLFDGITTTAQSGYIKPDIKAFQYLISRYAIDPKTAIFIDDQAVNVYTAQAMGMKGIICNNHTHVADQLIKLGVFNQSYQHPKNDTVAPILG